MNCYDVCMASTQKLSFEPFSEERIAASRDAWNRDAADGLAFPTEVDRLFDWVSTHQVPTEHDAVAYGVFTKGSNVACGICEVIIQRKSIRSKWIKMLKLTLKPSVDNQLQTGDSEGAMSVFTESIIGSARLQLTHKANTLKVYGRTHEQLNFLKALVRHIDGAADAKGGSPYKATIEGRFLSIVAS